MSISYRVQCYRQGLPVVCGMSEWHADLASALPAFLAQQQGPWQSVALEPQGAQMIHQEQRGFVLYGERRGAPRTLPSAEAGWLGRGWRNGS